MLRKCTRTFSVHAKWYGEQGDSKFGETDSYYQLLVLDSTKSSLFAVSVTSSSFHKEFHELYWRIFTLNPIITTDPHLNVISCGERQSYIEPRWWVEGTTRASGTTPLSVPQGITIWIENTRGAKIMSYAWLTEVVLANKRGNIASNYAPSDARTRSSVTPLLILNTSSKGPDVLARRAMCHANSVNILIIVDWPTRTVKKGLWMSYLVANDPPTHLVVLHTTCGVAEPLTATAGGSSPTHSVWSGVLPPHRGTLLGGVRHVEVGYMSPANWAITGIWWLSQELGYY